MFLEGVGESTQVPQLLRGKGWGLSASGTCVVNTTNQADRCLDGDCAHRAWPSEVFGHCCACFPSGDCHRGPDKGLTVVQA